MIVALFVVGRRCRGTDRSQDAAAFAADIDVSDDGTWEMPACYFNHTSHHLWSDVTVADGAA